MFPKDPGYDAWLRNWLRGERTKQHPGWTFANAYAQPDTKVRPPAARIPAHDLYHMVYGHGPDDCIGVDAGRDLREMVYGPLDRRGYTETWGC